MNNESLLNALLRKYGFLIFGIIAIILLVGLIQLFQGGSAQKPAEDEELSSDYAQLFNSGEFYGVIDQSDENFALVQKDLATFAHTTGEKLQDPSTKIAFTFDSGFTQNDNVFIFTGEFYDLPGKIRLELTKYDKGIINLSITNEKSQTNIDNSLNLNGKKNELLAQLPINETYYSIRYLYSDDAIIVSFYDGFSSSDVERATEVLKTIYEDEYESSLFRFNINGVGTFTLDGIYQYLQNPYTP